MGIKNRKPTSEALWILGTNVRRLRLARGLTQVALSRITGLPNKYISSIEHEKKKATLANIEAIAKGLECLMCDLFMPIKEKNMDEEQRQKVRAEIITRFRSNLKRIREAAGIAQEDLDRRCGLPPGETKNLEEGVKGCTLGAIQDIADELGCRFHELLQRLQM